MDMSNLLSRLNSYCKIYDDKLFTKVTQGNHVMHHLLPSPKSTCYNLRTLGHGLSVNPVKPELHKNTFINRLIFDDIYWFLFYIVCIVSLCFFLLVCMFLFLYFFLSFMCLYYHITRLTYYFTHCNKWMNKWMNERMNEQTNKQTCKQINK